MNLELSTGEVVALWQALQSLKPAFRDPHLEEVLRPYCIEAERLEEQAGTVYAYTQNGELARLDECTCTDYDPDGAGFDPFCKLHGTLDPPTEQEHTP